MHKLQSLIIFLFAAFPVLAQPGPDVIFPTDINLNEYPNFGKVTFLNADNPHDVHFRPKILGIVTIDCTSDLSLIPLLKKEESLSLRIATTSIPAEFKDFDSTISLFLTLENDLTDLNFLNEFPNLQTFRLQTKGDLNFTTYVALDSLKFLEVEFSGELTNLKVFEKVVSLNKVSLRYVPKLKRFPEFDTSNRITSVNIYQETGDGCTNCPPNPNIINLEPLNRLRRLQRLDLSNVNGISKIPGDLSKELRVFTMFDVQRANKDYAIRSYLEDVSAFGNYEKLEVIEISGVHIKAFKGDFSRLNLKNLTFRWVYGLEDISGLFTMQSIKRVWIEKCMIHKIDGADCAVRIDQMIFSDCSRIENIDFILGCEHINKLQLGGGIDFNLPSPTQWKIPNLSLYANGDRGMFHVKKENGVIIEKVNLEAYIR